ncbi:hypothetical protein DNH61_15390 [Paenibacillus sambharensis]|uniref:Uncharacterized protein n=1 Tax=Paenibacillus sambharensis TaxID=1803190 RepID=A0A2W1LT49_9BACL|nr:hypothetical protein [Paenibacillus sambharensis]PZD95021.1 hypothetical protein DNH61_15390 [Paenibacillus sambharensis]
MPAHNNGHQNLHQDAAVDGDTPSTSAKESNENDIHMKGEHAAFQSKSETASQKLRYDNADEVYPES